MPEETQMPKVLKIAFRLGAPETAKARKAVAEVVVTIGAVNYSLLSSRNSEASRSVGDWFSAETANY